MLAVLHRKSRHDAVEVRTFLGILRNKIFYAAHKYPPVAASILEFVLEHFDQRTVTREENRWRSWLFSRCRWFREVIEKSLMRDL